MSQLSLMPRIACVEAPALPLQLVLRKHPEWRQDPLVILAEDKPSSPVLWANQPARSLRINRGLPFAQAKTLSATLRAQLVPDSEIQLAVDEIFDRLLNYSPCIEPSLELPGLFFVDPSGLGQLFGNYHAWATQVQRALRQDHYVTAIAVGFSRPLLYALTRAQKSGLWVSECSHSEQERAHRVPLLKLHLPQHHLEDMEELGVRTLGDLLRLPSSQLRTRYGAELSALHDFLNGKTWTPLQPHTRTPPLSAVQDVDPPDADVPRLLFGIKGMLHRLLPTLAERCEAISALQLDLQLEYLPLQTSNREATSRSQCTPAPVLQQRIETAAPTLDLMQIIELLRLRIQDLQLPAPINHITLTLAHTRIHPKQLALQQAQHKRDLTAANRALARIKAKFGDTSVTKAQLRPVHLPESKFTFIPDANTTLPTPQFLTDHMPLVRRIHRTPIAIPHGPTHNPASFLTTEANLRRLSGPYRIAGGWWARQRHRDYYFAETNRGDFLWLFYDGQRKRWFSQGLIR